MSVDKDAVHEEGIVIGKYRVKIIRHLCIGAASCVAVSPDVFDLDGENIAVIKPDAQGNEDDLLMAAQSCPTRAIELYDNETGEKVWPL